MGNSTGNADKKNPRKQAKMIKEKEDAGICRNKKEKAAQEKITVQLEEINQKVLANEERLKRYRQRIMHYRQNRSFQNNERKFNQQLGRDDKKTYQNRMPKERNDFSLKYGYQKI